jgi:dihydrolipoamide dehydrogenase
MEAMGLTVDGAGVSLERFQAWRGELCLGLARAVGDLLAAGDVAVVHGRARFNRPDRVAVRTAAGGARFLEFEHAIVATGSRSIELPGLPFDGESVLDSTAALALTAVPESVAAVGAGYIGLELGTALAKLGARVTVVEALDRILPTVDAALTRPVLRRLDALGVDLRLSTTAERLAGATLVVRDAGGEHAVAAERVVVAVGRVPNTDDLGLAAAGVSVGPDGLVAVGEDGRATPRIAAIGDVVAGPALAHKASAEGIVAAEALSGRPAAFEPAAIPAVIFTDPEIGTVGLTEAEARDEGMDVRTATFPLAASGRAATLGATDGFTRLVVDAATDRVVGVHVVGPHASELVAGATLAVELMASPEDLAGTIHPHPTLSESLHEAAELVLGHPIHVATGRTDR